MSTSKQRESVYSWGPFGVPIDYVDELVRDINRLREVLTALLEKSGDEGVVAKAKVELERTK